MSSNYLKILSMVCRLIIAVTFLISGFTKVIDPWGTAIKINEYLAMYGFEFLKPASMVFSIWLCGAEFMMGCMLLFKVRIRLVSIFAFASLVFFTILTFLSATWLPVEDCGCFGEAIKLTAWQTFAKNVVLLPMAIVVWYRYRRDKIFAFRPMEIVLTVFFFMLSMGIGVNSCRHLPWIDFLPYKVGVNIYDAINSSEDSDEESLEVTLVYRSLATGEERGFSLDDVEWQDDTRWEWVRTETEQPKPSLASSIGDFAARDVESDVTEYLLTREGRLYMICLDSFDKLSKECELRLAGLVERAVAEGAEVVCLTPEPMDEVTYHSFGDSQGVRCYNADASLLKTMLRANVGVLELVDGTIVDKRSCIDIEK